MDTPHPSLEVQCRYANYMHIHDAWRNTYYSLVDTPHPSLEVQCRYANYMHIHDAWRNTYYT